MKILNTLLISLLAYSASAQVGIGTSTPSVPLDIEAANAAIDINSIVADPLIHFQILSNTKFTIGVDSTDNKFKIGTTALETGTAVTVQSTGEVGIGTTSPGGILHIEGTDTDQETILRLGLGRTWDFKQVNTGISSILTLEPEIDGKEFKIVSEDGTDLATFFTANTDASQRVYLLPDGGYVGIGTSGPSAPLEVVGNGVGDNGVIFELTSDAGRIMNIKNPLDADASSPYQIYTNNSFEFLVDALSTINIEDDGDVRFQGGTDANLLFIDRGSDAVGIGTSTPSSNHLLSMFSSKATVGEVVGVKMSNANAIDLEIGVTGASYTAVGQTNAGLINVVDLQPLIFGTNNTERMRISETGNVGIGTTSPSGVLDIQGSDTDGEIILQLGIARKWDFKQAGTGVSTILTLEPETDGKQFQIVSQDGTGLATFITNNIDANQRVYLLPDGGNVGIGMTSPSVELDVTGDIEYTGTIVDVSDRRLKENFSSIDSVLTKIMKIEGLSYNMIADSIKTREYGVVAQDVQKVFPAMVKVVDPENGYLGVSYIQLVPVLLEATKAQQAIIEAQKKEIATEKAENESQKQEIETIKAEASSAKIISTETAQKLSALEAKLNALLLLNSKGAVLTAEN